MNTPPLSRSITARSITARNVGTLCFGSALLGAGCTLAQKNDQKRGAEFNHQPGVPIAGETRKRGLPQPNFGPIARKALDSSLRVQSSENSVAARIVPALKTREITALPTENKPALRSDFLASVSEGTLIEAIRPPLVPAEDTGSYAPAAPEAVANENAAELAPQPPIQIAPLFEEIARPQDNEEELAQAPVPTVGEPADIPAQPAAPKSENIVTSEPEIRTAADIKAEGLAEVEPAGDEPEDSRRRTIPARTEEAELPPGEVETEAKPAANLALLIPSQRVMHPMVTTELPAPQIDANETANDSGTVPLSMPDTFEPRPAQSLVPPPRVATTLGLEDFEFADDAATTSAPPVQSEPAELSPSRSASFSTSAESPQLSYQDELILEIRIAGVDASDTILAYGTRGGVYLPIGTLSRILDVAVTVSDDGNYASGWVLDEKRTLTIDLRQGLLTISGEEKSLPKRAAVAFEGELYLLADRMSDFLPLTVQTDLRGQVVTLKTLEPFPFEERMRREAERQRLVNRGQSRQDTRWPRQETPWQIASLPMTDVEIRVLSDSTFGLRSEVDLQLAGDLGFLTAQAFLNADTRNGLTTSLIEVGRQDPDADLLGPLSATEFAAGDVSTVSMPLGLRSVTGRGFTATNTPPEAVSVFERIDLRGILPGGYEVELYRNDILVGSTREAVNGQYEFLQVPVDFGLNVFRLVFFGPQGQRSEQVKRISVGDGRLAQGKLVYRVGAVQKDENVLGVRQPNFIPPRDFGTWRGSAEIAYGLSNDITAVMSGAWFETVADTRWVTTAGIRTGINGFAIKADLAAASGNAFAINGGIGGRIGSSAFTLSHIEYSGDFIDETRSVGGEFLLRSSELDFNTSISLGNPVSGVIIPLTARVRHVETDTGRTTTDASLRASTRLPGFLASNTLEYSRTALPQVQSQSRLFGNFDLATLGRARTRGRVSLGYQVLPNPDLTSAAIEVDHAIDKDTAIRGSVGYAFLSKSTQVGLSAVRDFDRFNLALEGNYGFADKAYSVGLRLGFSFGRDPLRRNFFLARPGIANSGGASVRAFRDMDGDGIFGAGDTALPDVTFAAFNQTAQTGEDGIARLGGLGSGRGVSIQIDPSSLPDIDLAPAVPGIEIVPRPGRLHGADFPIVALSEVEGSLTFQQGEAGKGVSGVRLKLQNADGEDIAFAKTEIDGYFFFERVKPGAYTVALDSDQASRLNLCMKRQYFVDVGFESDIVKTDIDIGTCGQAGASPE